ncbi:ELMO domain-containing protein 2 [Tetranychus urticae]|uniref:ELMO domain-containing protein n=1 Tax=Tetranychus urticae TaxID=32264 RepID=T1KNJ6_TETUR|nr:ELMO domain-containing protein 2 [Tetranychus urticae]
MSTNKPKSVLPSWMRFQLVEDIFNYAVHSVISLFSYYFTLILKILLRKCTGLCELQRICYKTEKGAQRSLEVEKCIYSSRRKVIRRICEKLDDLAKNGRFNSNNTCEVVRLVEHAVEAICVEKDIKPSIHPEFVTAMRICFLQIYGYKNLQHEIDSLRSIPFDSTNQEHEEKLLLLWKTLNPDYPLKSRVTKQWTEIGFQGEDPKTDFRGMGILGLENLLYFATNFTKTARCILLHSNHPSHGFPFAITGINLTYIAFTLLNNNRLKTHFYNSHFGTTCLEDFHRVYCYLFYTFDKLWIEEKPKDVMEFSYIKEKFVCNLNTELEKHDAILRWNPPVEDI